MQIKSSATQPIILPLKNIETGEPFNIMYKNDDLRKDQLIIALINIINNILIDAQIDAPIVRYAVRPISCDSGFIELVPNSFTLNYIKEVQKSTILNFIMNNNPNLTVISIREKFLKSCSVYSIICYVFGISDRHLDNIMISSDASTSSLFNIDYSYILNRDPVKFTSVKMRVSTDMVEAFGNKNYEQFKTLCNQIYNAIRPYINLFINFLMILSVTHKEEFTEEHVYNELISRMCPGENNKQAIVQISAVIESCNSDYEYQLIDYFHSKSKIISKKTLMDSIYGIFK